MKLALAFLLLAGCSTREVVRIERVPVTIVEKYILMVPVKPPLPKMEPHPGQSWASLDNCL